MKKQLGIRRRKHKITGKPKSDEKRKKIIDKIVSDKVPKNVDKMF